MPTGKTTTAAEDDAVAAAATAGDEPAFASLVERHRRELHVHGYRMLGSFDEAEDVVQEAFLRAWRRLASLHSFAEVPWLQPHPDRLLDEVAPATPSRTPWAIAPLLGPGLSEPGEWRLLPTRANRQPAAASYLRARGGSGFPAFGLPPTLPPT